MEVLRAHQVLIWHDTLDGGNDKLVLDTGLEFLQMTLEIGRGSDKHERVVSLNDAVYVAREEDFVHIEVHTCEIGGVVTQSSEVFDAVVAAHVPPQVVGVVYHYLGDSRSPRTSTDDGCFSYAKHKSCFGVILCCFQACALSIHCWMTSTPGFSNSSLYFLCISPNFCCSP